MCMSLSNEGLLPDPASGTACQVVTIVKTVSGAGGRYYYYLCSLNHKQGKEACNARKLPKEKIVVAHIKTDILNNESPEKMVLIVNEELSSANSGLKERLDIIDAELYDTRARLSRQYDAIETGKIAMENLSSNSNRALPFYPVC